MAKGDVLFKNGAVTLASTALFKSDVLVKQGRIAEVGPDLRLPRGAELIDATGHHIAPGFIDLHIHGAAGQMFEFADPDGYAKIATTVSRFGTTGFLATLAAMSHESTLAAINTAREFSGNRVGAKMLGIHMEGPYLSPEMAGAQIIPAMRRPSVEELNQYREAAGDLLKIVTLAPELDGALELISALRRYGVVAAAGHSDATFEQIRSAIPSGLTHVSHTFNAMRGLHHREPGVVGAALAMDLLTTELICDGHHVAPAAASIVMRCKPRDKVVLVSDAVAALGLPEGDHDFLGIPVSVKGGVVRLKHSNNLAGSVLTLNVAVKNVFQWFGNIPLREVLLMASLNPAKVIGADDSKGQIAVGKDADIILMDEYFDVALTMVEGRIVYRRQ
ncbi:MAG: N-acetylglucosamine-6-phosphate deacetylase [Candidatus Hydrogenedentota bacterium]|nr:MAG: N-acetylglucosamine-6-phosphate deacetylase [Candidatus Hydrogenedentota bacterium]